MKSAVLILLPDPTDEAATTFQRMCASGGAPRLILADYDHQHPEAYDGERVVEPMDVLTSADIDAIFAAGYASRSAILKSLPDSVLRASAGAWLPSLTSVILQFHRVVRLYEKALANAETYAVAGKHPVFPYYRLLAHRVAARLGVRPVDWQADEAAASVQAGPAPVPEDLAAAASNPVEATMPLEIDERTKSELIDYGNKFGSRWGEPLIVLAMRFGSSTKWFHDSRTNRLLHHDSYNELYMERLARACRSRGWRLAILSLDAAAARPDGACSLADAYPNTVVEVLPGDFKRRRQLQRPEAEGVERARISRYLTSAAFRSTMVVNGTPIHDCLSSNIISTLATQHVQIAASEGANWWPLIKALRPSAIIGARLDSFPEFIRGASLLGVPSVALRFGIGHEMTLATMDEAPQLAPAVSLAWGEQPARHLSNFAPGIVAVGPGRPRNDVFVLESGAVDKAAVKARLGLAPTDRLILVGLNCRTRFGELARGRGQGIVSPRTLERCITALAALAESLGNVRIIMKPHGSDDMDMLHEIMARCGRGLASVARNKVEGFHNVEILAASELLIANPSSMMAEATCCGVPSVMLATPDVKLFFEEERISGYGSVGRRADSVEDMRDIAARLMTDPAFRAEELERSLEGVRLYFGAVDGYNADRTAAAICRIVDDTLRRRVSSSGKDRCA